MLQFLDPSEKNSGKAAHRQATLDWKEVRDELDDPNVLGFEDPGPVGRDLEFGIRRREASLRGLLVGDSAGVDDRPLTLDQGRGSGEGGSGEFQSLGAVATFHRRVDVGLA